LDSATVTLTVSDGTFSTGAVQNISLAVDPTCSEVQCPFGTPIGSALPSINTTFENIFTIGNNAPNLDNISNFAINWSLPNNGLYQFSINTNNGSPAWYIDLRSSSTHSFNATEPQVTITGSGIDGLDGTYYAAIDNGNFALVSADAGFTLYFSTTNTAPDCSGGGDPDPDPSPDPDPTNTNPIANLTATPTQGVTPLEVAFDASGSSDADGDTLTYAIDYGDGTTETGVTSTHTYTSIGVYTAILTVNDGNGGTDTARVTITVDEEIVVDPDPDPQPTGDCTFGAPSSSALGTIHTTFENTYVFGTGGPNLDMVQNFTVNWDLQNNGLYQFSFNINIAPWYINFSNAAQNFNAANPAITLANTGIAGLDGDYNAVIHEGNFVLVADTYTIYFSTSATPPNCDPATNGRLKAEQLEISMYPNPAVSSISISNKNGLQHSMITISDLSGKEIMTMPVAKSSKNMSINLSDIEAGLYLVRVLDANGNSRTLKLLIK